MPRIGFLASMAVVAAILAAPAPAIAQQTPEEHAHQWTEARRGDRDWMQRATEQLTMGPLDRMMGPSADEAMKQILNNVIDHIDAMYNRRMDPCLAAAVNQAHNQSLTIGRQEIMRGAAEMLFDAGGGAAGGRNLAEFLGQTLYEQIKDKIKDRAIDEFKGRMRDRMKEGLPVYYRSTDNRAPCKTSFSVVWDKRQERYEFLFAGDCACNTVPCGKMINGSVPLRRWTITGSGSVVPNIEQLRNGDIRITFGVGRPQNVQVTADCCGEGPRRYRADPRNGAADEWVGFEPPPATTTTPPRSQTGATPPEGQPGTTGQPRRQPAAPPPIQIPPIPDGPLTDEQMADLEQRVFDAEERAQSERQAAERRVFELEQNNASEADLAAARAAAETAAETHRAARAARERLADKARQQAEQQQQQQEQSSLPPDPRSAEFLAAHNSARREAGAPPLQWDRRLASNAAAHAAQLARIGQLVHAPRAGRGVERENLSRGMIGWGAQQMMANWLRERRNFVPGVFPNVSRTGRWEDVAHYTQIIWPTTTRLGCGTASGNGFQWLVCRYSPGGNKDGKPVGAAIANRTERGR